MKFLHSYITHLNVSRSVLWCYFIWYLVMTGFNFVPTPRIWLTSLGISAFVGTAFWLNTTTGKSALKAAPWQIFRLYLIPFCVSSFSSLVKDRGFVLIFSPKWEETGLALGICTGFLVVVVLVQFFGRFRAMRVHESMPVERLDENVKGA